MRFGRNVPRGTSGREVPTGTTDIVAAGGGLLESSCAKGIASLVHGIPEAPVMEKRRLGRGFERVRVLDLPFLIREHARKFQWSVAQASVWIRQRGE